MNIRKDEKWSRKETEEGGERKKKKRKERGDTFPFVLLLELEDLQQILQSPQKPNFCFSL
jgi:hypothetical protein